ncbi:MAG: chemotaxis protein CheA [Spirochaetales bacterium]|nr:MAG: chemotaxis protein CheA [Spirochaetales bacterium]
MSDYLDPNNEELLKDFFSEAQGQVETLEHNILALESEPSNHESIDEIFRAAHTLKGGSATVQMMELSEFTHLVEDVLDEIRSGKAAVTGEIVDLLLASIDIIKSMLEARLSGVVFDDDISDIKKQLKNVLEGRVTPAVSAGTRETGITQKKPVKMPEKGGASVPAGEKAGGLSEYDILEMREAAEPGEPIFQALVTFDENNPMNSVGGIQVFAVLKELGRILKTQPEFEMLYEDKFFPVVTYYFASRASEEDILRKLDMPDVVRETDLKVLPDVSAPAPVQEKPDLQVSGQVAELPAGKARVEEEEEAGEKEKAEKKVPGLYKEAASAGSVLRVDSRRIDTLLNLISEAVITKATFNQVGSQFAETLLEFQHAESLLKEKQKMLFDSLPDYLEAINRGKTVKEIRREIFEEYGSIFSLMDGFETKFKNTVASFRNTAQILGRNTGELHEKVLQIRMVPISQIFSRFPRLVRDLSKTLNKQIKLIMEGEDTELDKSVIEDVLDPLIHCVRNSVDHGIESPAERKEAGKTEEGHVLLKASNEGNMIVIEISDDGKGIDVDVVRQKAVERGIIHPGKALSAIEAFNLIFEAGFSTAKAVTNLSGRGVGLDVVKKQIEKLNGSIAVWSEKGKGTRMTIRLPLTLAIIQGLLVRVGKEIYAIPITSVLDSHRIKPSDIKLIDNYEVFNVREDVVSLVRLGRLFKLESEERTDYHFIVIVGSGDKKMGLMVDSLIGEEDVVIKPLKDRYTNSPGIAGATILGDGTVSLIIDVSQLLDLCLKQEREERRVRLESISTGK